MILCGTSAWICGIARSRCTSTSMVVMVFQYYFSLTVLLSTYNRIGVAVLGNEPPGAAKRIAGDQRLAASKSKMVRMMIAVVTAFTLCWLSLNALIVAGDQDTRIWQYRHIVYIWFASHWLAMSHAAYNPVIYCWMNDRFREGFLRIYHRVCCRKGSSSSPYLHRCNTYTIYTSSLSSHSKCRPSPAPSTKLTMQPVTTDA